MHDTIRAWLGSGIATTTALMLAGCSVGPDYHAPELKLPQAWEAARPVERANRTDTLIGWWDRFHDPVLTELLRLAESDSPSLDKAWANIASARAALGTNLASGRPSLTADSSLTRARSDQGETVTQSTSRSLALDASWEIDVFGKVRRNVESAEALIDARIDDWHDARITLAAEVADDYVQYRACQQLAAAYREEASSQQETARATLVAVQAGFTSRSDGDLAEASAASARATAIEQQGSCDVLVKALVALTGTGEGQLRTVLAKNDAVLPTPDAFAVTSVPAVLLNQRPDLASYERALASASADIGAAEAGRYPTLSLSGTITLAAAALTGGTTSWSLGPTVSAPLLDGGKTQAAVDSAKAAYDLALAEYRQGARTAVQETEQALVNLDSATRRAGDSQLAAQKYRQYFEAIDAHWRAGGESLLNREEARRSALSADITYITLQRDQVQYWIALYKALGGGWHPATPAVAPADLSTPATGASR